MVLSQATISEFKSPADVAMYYPSTALKALSMERPECSVEAKAANGIEKKKLA